MPPFKKVICNLKFLFDIYAVQGFFCKLCDIKKALLYTLPFSRKEELKYFLTDGGQLS